MARPAAGRVLFGGLHVDDVPMPAADLSAHVTGAHRRDMVVDQPQTALRVERPEAEPCLQVAAQADLTFALLGLDEKFAGAAGRDVIPGDARTVEQVVVRHQMRRLG